MLRMNRREFLQFSAVAGLALTTARPIPWLRQSPMPAPRASAKKQFTAFAEEVKRVMQASQVPGIAVGIIRDNKLVYADGFGVRNVNTGAPMTAKSVMSMASISKAFTATGIMQLIEAKRINGIDDRFLAYVPYFSMASPRYPEITLRHLLSHTAGMPPLTDADFFPEFMTPDFDAGAAERLVRSLSTIPLVQDPGGPDFIYSDIGYDVLADLIHKVTGELFEDYMRRHILDPLKMKDSTFLFTEIKPKDLVAAHVRDANGNVIVWDYFPYDRKHAPSSCLHCNVEDYSQWLLAHLNGGAWQGKRILQPASQAQLWEKLYDWGGADFLTGYGWGWELGEFRGRKLVTSFGGQPGVQTVGALLPTEGLGAIVLGNCLGTFNPDIPDPYVVGDLAYWALDWLLGGGATERFQVSSTADEEVPTGALTSTRVYLPFMTKNQQQ